MKEIKAYVRSSMANHVITALVAVDGLDFSVLDVRGISHGLPRAAQSYSVQLGELYGSMVKFEIVCREENTAALIDLIRSAASTGRKGDGMIFVSDVVEAIRINTGDRGEDILPRWP